MRWSEPASAKQRANKRNAPLSRNFDFIRRIPVKTAGDEPVERPEAFQELRRKKEDWRSSAGVSCQKNYVKSVLTSVWQIPRVARSPRKNTNTKKRHIKHTKNQTR